MERREALLQPVERGGGISAIGQPENVHTHSQAEGVQTRLRRDLANPYLPNAWVPASPASQRFRHRSTIRPRQLPPLRRQRRHPTQHGSPPAHSRPHAAPTRCHRGPKHAPPPVLLPTAAAAGPALQPAACSSAGGSGSSAGGSQAGLDSESESESDVLLE